MHAGPWEGGAVEVNEILAKAWAEVQKANLPKELQEFAFKEAIGLLTTDAKPPRARVTGTGPDGPKKKTEEDTDAAPAPDPVDSDALFTAFATETGIDQEALEEVFFFDANGLPAVNAPARKLGVTITSQAQTAATALVAANYFVRNETSTPLSRVKSECERLKCHDKNFVRHMGKVTGATLSGPADNRVLRARAGEIAAALSTVVNSIRGVKE